MSPQVYLVDDDEAIRGLAQQALMKFGYKVVTASTGEEALDLYSEKVDQIDLVVMDLGMPGMGGHEACRRIKAIRKTRVAMLSSLKSQGDHKEGHIAGCDNYLTKPPQDGDLQAVLRIMYLRKSISA